MGRRSLIPVSSIERLFSAFGRMQKEKERDRLINTSGGTKELPPSYSVTSVDFNTSSRVAKIHFQESKHYRTVDRYVTRNHIKYPLLSDWKTKTKNITKTLKLTNDELERLQSNEDYLIRRFAFDIITNIGIEDIYPSWYLIKAYGLDFEETLSVHNLRIEGRQKHLSETKERITTNNKNLLSEADALTLSLNKVKKKIDRCTTKISKASERKKSALLNIVTCFIYCYLRSSRYINRLNNKKSKKEELYMQYTDEINSIETIVNNNISELQAETESVDKFTSESKEKIEDARKKMMKRISSVTPLLTTVETDRGFFPLKDVMGMNAQTIIGCYIIRNTENQKCYVGQSKNILRRLKQHFNGTEPKNIIFAEDYYKSQRSDLNNLFEVKIIECATKDELDRKEKELIEEYNSCEKGYNNTKGNA